MNPTPIRDPVSYRNEVLDNYVKHLQNSTDSLWDMSNGMIKTCKGLKDENWVIWPQLPYENKLLTEQMLFSDLYSGEFFWSTIEIVQQAMYHTNRNISLKGYEVLSEWYEFLGIGAPFVDLDNLGWSLDYLLEMQNNAWLDFYVQHMTTGDGEPYIAIAFDIDPIPFEEEGY